MAAQSIIVDGIGYSLAPMEPELWDRPSPSYPLVITPAIAHSYLTFNYRNRNQRDKGKRDYGADMSEGNFDINGDSIRFTRPLATGEDDQVPAGKPVLLDGQHRLESCVASGKPFVAYVTFGLNPLVRRSIDKGIKRRFSDDLKMDGEINSNVLASLIGRAYAYSKGDRHLTMKAVGMTNAQGREFFDKHPELRRSVEVAVRTHDEFIGAKLRQSVVGVAHWLLMQADPTAAPEFFARLGDGVLPSKEEPMYHLRRRILQDKERRESAARKDKMFVPDWQLLCYIIRTWNVMLRNQTVPESKKKTEFMVIGRSDHRRMPNILVPQRESNGAISGFSPLTVGIVGVDEMLNKNIDDQDDQDDQDE